MLNALYNYAKRRELILPAGYVKKTVKAYISLAADGTFSDIKPGSEEAVVAPDIGSLNRTRSNVLADKRSNVIPEEPTVKSGLFLSALKDAGKVDHRLLLCAAVLENDETAQKIREKLNQNKVKDGDIISFKVDGYSVLEGEKVHQWWMEYRHQLFNKGKKGQTICLITGEETTPIETTPPIKGLHAVGGHGGGDALICFDKSAFRSFGLKQAANAPVSEEAYAGVKAALDDLLAKAPKLSGMKFVHWYDKDLAPEEDIIQNNADLWGDFGDDDEEEAAEEQIDEAQEWQEKNISAVKAADALVESVDDGTRTSYLGDVSYFILLLSGVTGRVMIRRYERGSYEELQKRLRQWHDDLELTNSAGTAPIKPVKLTARMLSLLSYQKGETRPFERLGKELSGLTPTVYTAILTGCPLPDTVAIRALNHIRSKLYAEEEISKRRIGLACQWLKVWLIRSKNKGDVLMKEYNPEYHSNAYYCGAMMAIFENIQQAAMPDVNATIMQRFYASAIQTPALVIGRLSKMSVHHLEMMENQWLADKFKKEMEEISTHMEGKLPAVLSLEEQSEFALGYYQMSAKQTKERIDRIAEKKAKEQSK